MMFNFPIFVEGLLMPLLGLGVFVIHKRSKRKKENFMYHQSINYVVKLSEVY